MTTKKGNEAIDELETHLGRQVRRARRAAGHTQHALADLAGVSVGTIKNLEAGAGSTLTTLMRVTQALHRETWIDAFHRPDPDSSPFGLLQPKNTSR